MAAGDGLTSRGTTPRAAPHRKAPMPVVEPPAPPAVWVVDPVRRIVPVLRPDATPEGFAGTAPVTRGPELPGFPVPRDRVFTR